VKLNECLKIKKKIKKNKGAISISDDSFISLGVEIDSICVQIYEISILKKINL
jgi:hypothetical protein